MHGANPRSRILHAALPILQSALEKINARIAVSEAARTTLVEHLGGDAVLIPNGVSVRRYEKADPLPGWPGEGGAIGFLGRMDEPRKGLPILLRAFETLGPQRPGLRLLIAGPGDLDEAAARVPAPLRDRVVLLGQVSEADKVRAYHSVDVFCAPNTGGESFGIVLAEAMAAGLPIVASDLDAFRTVLRDGRAGELFETGDAGDLARAVGRLLDDPERRATLSAAASAVLANDGTIRWTGAAVGKLIAGEEVLKPRVRVVADEQLTGAPRDAVETRLGTFVKSHLEKLLGPLFVLSAAEDVTGIARGVAFQLVEALGVLDRQKVADEVKGLEQPARASLRKYGVRFGAYHVYVPALLKPGPRALAAQLWALAHEGSQGKGLDDLLHLAGSGRTSIPVNREIDAALYGMAGYRVCGERAVRVDILERLSDLIRPALSWREGSPGPKPQGAFPGGGFIVFNGMTSLIGASGEDFASVLRSLGYRMERRPKPPEPAPVAPAQEPPQDVTADVSASPVVEAETVETVVDAEAPATPIAEAETAETAIDAAASATPIADVETAASDTAPEVSHEAFPEPVEAALQPAADLVTMTPDEPAETSTAPAEIAPAQSEPVPASAEQETAKAAEPVLIEVWRPGRVGGGRPEGRRRPRFPRREGGRDSRPSEQGAPQQPEQVATADAGAPPTPEVPPKEDRQHRHRRRQKPDQRFDRPQRERERDRERPERGPRPPRYERREREKAPDPNSPFAKLAALKAQLEAEAKERR